MAERGSPRRLAPLPQAPNLSELEEDIVIPIRLFRSLAASLILVLAAYQWAAAAPPLPTAPPESMGLSSERLAKIGVALQKAIDEGGFPGAVIMVARKGKLVYSEALGMQTPSKKMAEDSIFRIYSMTKPLVSVAAMLLVEDGDIQLTDPVGKFLPGFDKMTVSVESKDPSTGNASFSMVANARPMTIQDLLRHTSGLTYGGMTQNAPVNEGYEKAGVYIKAIPAESRGMTPAEQVERLAKVPLAYQPGTIWQYGLSTDILGRVVEVVSRKRLADFLRERIFEPLKMSDTGFWVPKEKHSRLAGPFATDKASGEPIVLLDVSAEPLNDSGGAGGISTASDYLRFCQMLLNGGALDGARVMSRTTVRLMTSDHLGTQIDRPMMPGELLLDTVGYTFGLGFAVRREDGVAGVPGSAGDFTWGGYAGTYFWVDPHEQLTAVFMTQAPGPMRRYYRKLVRQLVYQSIMD
jgi:CubicO group peptidase (beta-lactamase class C family)